MTPEILQTLPPWGIALGLIGAVVIGVILGYGLLSLMASAVRKPASPDGPTLAEQAEPILRARRGVGKFDAQFDRLIEGTRLGIGGDTAVGWILLIAVIAAAAVYLPTFNELLAGGAAVLAGGFTYVFFWGLRNRRKRAIQEQLPDGCFQLARSLRAGLALPGALRETASYVPAPLSKCFERLATALSLGESTRGSIRRVADDAEVTEFDLVTEVIALHAESGGHLPALLDRLAGSIRDRNQYRGYFRSVTAMSRLAALFLALAAPTAVLMYVLFQREMFDRFLAVREGQTILTVAIVLEVCGVIWLAVLNRRQDDY